MADEFVHRFRELFDFASMADIARRVGVPHATVRNYFQGRLPAPEVLMKIAAETGVSLNWLLLGEGEMYAAKGQKLNLGKLIDQRIEEIVEMKLAVAAASARRSDVQDLGTVDEAPEFDVEAALARHNDPHKVMSEWFRHERRRYPKDYGILFFQGWETYTDQERLDAIRDAKKVLDRTLRKKG